MRPSAVGYARITSQLSKEAVQDMRKDLAAYAEREGYTLAEVFMDREGSGSSAFAALIDALNRSASPIVVVPSMSHFAHFLGLRIAMKNLIERETCARVLILPTVGVYDQLAAG